MTVCSELDIAEAGTYYLGGDINNNYFFRVDVEEAAANVEPVVNEYDLEHQVWKQLQQVSLKMVKLLQQEQIIILHFI